METITIRSLDELKNVFFEPVVSLLNLAYRAFNPDLTDCQSRLPIQHDEAGKVFMSRVCIPDLTAELAMTRFFCGTNTPQRYVYIDRSGRIKELPPSQREDLTAELYSDPQWSTTSQRLFVRWYPQDVYQLGVVGERWFDGVTRNHLYAHFLPGSQNHLAQILKRLES